MYIRYINTKINDNLFDTRIDLSKLQYYIDKYKLKYVDRYKRYCIENIEIVSNGKTIDYKKTKYEIITIVGIIIKIIYLGTKIGLNKIP